MSSDQCNTIKHFYTHYSLLAFLGSVEAARSRAIICGSLKILYSYFLNRKFRVNHDTDHE